MRLLCRSIRHLSVISMLFVTGCTGGRFNSPYASGYYASQPMQCVPYARNASGIQLYGDAHTWWDQAYPNYIRSDVPRPGAVLVLSQTSRMQHGHLAVVKDVVNNRQINVTHSNWGSDRKNRRIIYNSVRVEDISPYNNWTQVRFWNYEANCFGFPYEAKGFIYK